MTVDQLINIAGILIMAGAAFWVSYLNRKQMRQIEQFRQEPNVGLTPPPSNLSSNLYSKRAIIIGVIIPTIILILEFVLPFPLTRLSVVTISMAVGLMILALLLHYLERTLDLINRMMDMFNKVLRIVEGLEKRSKNKSQN